MGEKRRKKRKSRRFRKGKLAVRRFDLAASHSSSLANSLASERRALARASLSLASSFSSRLPCSLAPEPPLALRARQRVLYRDWSQKETARHRFRGLQGKKPKRPPPRIHAPRMSPGTGDLVELNVGGTHFTTTKQTLTQRVRFRGRSRGKSGQLPFFVFFLPLLANKAFCFLPLAVVDPLHLPTLDPLFPLFSRLTPPPPTPRPTRFFL